MDEVAGQYATEIGVVCVALAGVAAEAKRLQVADLVGAAIVSGDDVVDLQCPLV